MKFYLLLTALLFAECGISQKKDISGTYVTTRTGGGDFGRFVEILCLNKDNSFSYYWNSDQLCYSTEDISFGHYRLKGDSIFLKSKYDSNNNSMNYFDYSGYKLKIKGSFLQTLEAISNDPKPQKVNYYKIKMSDFDSIKIEIAKSDSTITAENLFIGSDKKIKYAYSLYHFETRKNTLNNREFTLTPEKYKKVLEKISNSQFYSKSDRSFTDDICFLNLFMKNIHININSRFPLSESFYNFLFKELLKK